MTEIPAEPFPGHPRLIFMGTPDFAVPTLNALIAHGHNVLAVVTQPDRPKGRGKKLTAPPVKELALEHRIEVLQPEKASEDLFCAQIREKEPDLIVVVAFGQILRKKLLDIPRWGVINVHGSLLPSLRGAAPIQWTILNDEPKTGLTVMQMDEGMDTGPILFQEEVPVFKDETAGQLHDRLAVMAGDLMAKSLKRMSGNIVKGNSSGSHQGHLCSQDRERALPGGLEGRGWRKCRHASGAWIPSPEPIRCGRGMKSRFSHQR